MRELSECSSGRPFSLPRFPDLVPRFRGGGRGVEPHAAAGFKLAEDLVFGQENIRCHFACPDLHVQWFGVLALVLVCFSHCSSGNMCCT